MTEIQLSILIPCIPSRFDKAKNLISKLQENIADKKIEVLCLIDNKVKSIGEKRDDLVQVSNGKYFMFLDYLNKYKNNQRIEFHPIQVDSSEKYKFNLYCNFLMKQVKEGWLMFLDDDDDIENLDEVYEKTFLDVDVITFKSECRNSNGSKFIVTHHLGNEIEHTNDGNGNYIDCNRPPFHINAWNKKYKEYRFPFVSYGEDWGWLKQFVDLAQEEAYIDKIVYKYNFDPLITEASTESNSEWTNPNGYEQE